MRINTLDPFFLDASGEAVPYLPIGVSGFSLSFIDQGPYAGKRCVLVSLDEKSSEHLMPLDVWRSIKETYKLVKRAECVLFTGDVFEQQEKISPLVGALLTEGFDIHVLTDGKTLPTYAWAKRVKITVSLELTDSEQSAGAYTLRELERLGADFIVKVRNSNDVKNADQVAALSQCPDNRIWIAPTVNGWQNRVEQMNAPVKEALRLGYNYAPSIRSATLPGDDIREERTGKVKR